MAEQRQFNRRSYTALVLIILLTTATGLTLVHWHKEQTGQGCELCNVRQHSNLPGPAAAGPAAPAETELVWGTPDQSYEPAILFLCEPSRAPPRSIAFTI